MRTARRGTSEFNAGEPPVEIVGRTADPALTAGMATLRTPARQEPCRAVRPRALFSPNQRFTLHKKTAVPRKRGRAGSNTRREMFAVIKTGGKQYKVAADDEITIMTLPGEAGGAVTFAEVLSVVDGADLQFGAPFVSGASVAAEIVAQKRGPKVISFKKRRRQNSKRKRGHRQDLTVVRITDILMGGKSRVSRDAQADAPAAHADGHHHGDATAEAGAA